MEKIKEIWLLLMILSAVFLSACATAQKPFVYEPDPELKNGPGELKKGPGLFSGEAGAFTIYRKPARADEENAQSK